MSDRLGDVGPGGPGEGRGGEDEGTELFEEGAPTWVVTFGDLMSLLLTFFILMYSMSELKMDRFLLASQSLREAIGGTAPEDPEDPTGLMPDPVDPDLEMQNPGLSEGATAPLVVPTAEGDPGSRAIERFVEAYLDMLERTLRRFVEENGLEPAVRVERTGDGVYLRLGTAALFPSGSATLQPGAESLLGRLADITRTLHVGMTVSGHTDDRPISVPAFPSNWELSAARAAGVARTLVAAGQNPGKVRVESFGAHRPVGDNGTAEGRARNRRVDVFFARSDVVAVAKNLAALVTGSDPAR